VPYTHEQETEFERLFSVRRRRQMFLAASLFPLVIAAAMLRSSGRQELFGIRASMWGPGFLLLIVGRSSSHSATGGVRPATAIWAGG